MRTTHTLILPLLLIFSVTQNAESQFDHIYETWRWSHFTASSGLPSDVVVSIMESENNTPWISTLKGVAWYDGYRWNKIIVDSSSPNSSARMILKYHNEDMFVILDGKLYIGNTSGFNKVQFPNQSKFGRVSTVAAIDSASFLCVYETEDSAYVVKVKNGIDVWIPSPAPGRVYRTKNTVWLSAGLDIGLYVYKNDNWKKVFAPIGNAIALRGIVENEKGDGLIAFDAPKNNIGIWEFKDITSIKYSESERNQPIRALDISDNGDAIVVYESGEIHVRERCKWRRVDPIPRQMENVFAILFRENNHAWFATEKGIYLFKRDHNEWKDQPYIFSDLKNVVMEIFRSSKGDTWIGNLDGLEIQKNQGEREYVNEIHGVRLGLVTGINEDSHGNIWICAGGGAKGVFKWDGRKWEKHLNNSINYHKIRKRKNGDLWFLGLGVNKSDPAGYIVNDTGVFRIDSIYQLPSNRLYSFVEGKNGTIWIGTSEGLVRYNGQEHKKWGHELFGKNAKIYTMAADSDANIWFSTFSSYLGVLRKNEKFQWIWKKEEQYAYNEKIWDITFDSSGVLWIASSKGLFRYFNETWTNFGDKTGTNIRELRVVLPTNDKIYFGGHGIGVRSVQNQRKYYPIKVFLSKPVVDNNDALCSWHPDSYWSKHPSDEIETRFKLNDQDWSGWALQNTVTLKDLKSGKYSLVVQAKDPYGNVFNASEAQTFTIEPHLFLRPMFQIPITVLIGIIIALIIKYYQAKKQHLINMYNQRIRISNDLHDDVGSNLGSISLISQRLARKVTDMPIIREDLTIIGDTAVQTAEELRDIVWYINPNNDTIIGVHRRLREIADRQLRGFDIHFQHSEIIGDDLSLLNIRRNILLTYKEILHNVMKHSRAKNVTITVNHQPGRFTITVADDGVGFDHTKEYSGNGMRSMRKRVAEARGQLTIDSNVGMGTTVTVVFAQYSGV